MADGVAVELSRALAGATAAVGRSVVRLEARRLPSSGAVWREDGLVVAAAHAIEDDEAVDVGLPDGTTLRAEVVGRDEGTDVALLRVPAGGLAPVAWAPSGDDLPVGALALVVSRPGRSVRAALGVVAARADGWRTPGGGKLERYVEVDVALEPGRSGGVVVDASGRGLGLATSGLARGRLVAVPPETLGRVVSALLAHGCVRRGYLGVATLPARLGPALEGEVGQPTGLLVSGVEPDSPAERSGVLLGDVIVRFAGQPVRDVGDLLALLEEAAPDVEVPARLVRAGRLEDHGVRVGARGGAA
jgi:S1-C subfamily serine protease